MELDLHGTAVGRAVGGPGTRTPKLTCVPSFKRSKRRRPPEGILHPITPVSAAGDAAAPTPSRSRTPAPWPRGAELAYWAGRGCGRRPGRFRRSAAHSRNAAPRPRAPRHPGRRRQPGLLDRAGGGRGERPGYLSSAALLPVAECVLGPEYPDTSVNGHNLANFAGYAGDAAAARDQCAALLRVRERVFGALPRYCGGQVQPGLRTRACGGGRPGPVRRSAPRPRARIWPEPPDRRHGWNSRTGHVRRGRCCGPGRSPASPPSCERVLGPEHSETLAVWYQLAHWTALAADEGAAAKLVSGAQPT